MYDLFFIVSGEKRISPNDKPGILESHNGKSKLSLNIENINKKFCIKNYYVVCGKHDKHHFKDDNSLILVNDNETQYDALYTAIKVTNSNKHILIFDNSLFDEAILEQIIIDPDVDIVVPVKASNRSTSYEDLFMFICNNNNYIKHLQKNSHIRHFYTTKYGEFNFRDIFTEVTNTICKIESANSKKFVSRFDCMSSIINDIFT